MNENTGIADINTACPRCGLPFYCGASDARCDCFDLKLDDLTRQQVAAQYSGCLCLACLRELKQANQAPAGKT